MEFFQRFPLVPWPWMDSNENTMWMAVGSLIFLALAVFIPFIAGLEARKKYDAATPKVIRELFYLSLAMLCCAALTLIFGAWLLIPAMVIVIALVCYFIGRGAVRTFGYAFLGWPKPEDGSS